VRYVTSEQRRLESLKQNSLQMSHVFYRLGICIIRQFCFSRILARPLDTTDPAANAPLIPLHLAGLRRGLAS
jgi:hypothetical protein